MPKKLFIYLIIIISTASLLLGGCTAAVQDAGSERVVVAVVDGHIVEPFEFYVYLSQQKSFFEATGGMDIWYANFGGTDAQTQAKLNALRQLSLVRITAAQARLTGLEPSDESVRIATSNTYAYLAQLPPLLARDTGSTFDNIFPVMLERQLFEEMYEEVTRHFTVSQADFEHFFEGYMIAHPNPVQIIATVVAVSRLEGGANPQNTAHAIRQALEQSCELYAAYADNTAVSVTVMRDLANSDLPAGVIAATRNLDLRQVSPILQTADTYYIVRIDARQIVDADTLAGSALDEYIQLMRGQIFNEAYQNWRDGDPEIHINHEVFDAIYINDLRLDISASING
ncbi:MAG: hypothetical protein FWE20_01835 [Defluviitaleaceae bacterium]|nr:hypothetical protein [Defluviitaleaceae bacterium]